MSNAHHQRARVAPRSHIAFAERAPLHGVVGQRVNEHAAVPSLPRLHGSWRMLLGAFQRGKPLRRSGGLSQRGGDKYCEVGARDVQRLRSAGARTALPE